MEFYDAIKNRASIRLYKNEKVEPEVINRIVEAARTAPSWANKQCWRFVVVDANVQKNLIGKASGQSNIAKACEDAPYVIVLCADMRESGSKNGIDYFLFDSALAMENLILAASAEGLASCIVGWFDEKAIKAVLNIPAHMKVIAFTPVGYANEVVTNKSRRKKYEAVFHNTWGKPLDE